MDVFNPDTWKQQWATLMSAPYIMFPIIAIAVWVSWWLRGTTSKGEIAGLNGRVTVFEDRLRLAAEKAESADRAKNEVEKQFQAYKAEVGNGAPAATTAKVEAAIDKLATAINAVSDALAVPDAPHYMTAYEAIHYLADESEWGDGIRSLSDPQERRNGIVFGTLAEWKRVAEQGNIRAFGILNGVGLAVPIPDIYWISATINAFSIDNPSISQTMPVAPNPDGIPVYKNVRILRADVEGAWPKRKAKD
jgi:hypothetical protein